MTRKLKLDLQIAFETKSLTDNILSQF